MKNLILFFLSFVGYTYHLHAQFENLRIGVGLEPLSISWLDSNSPNVVRENSNLSFGLALKLEYHLSEYLSISSGFNICRNNGATMKYVLGGDVWKDSPLSDIKWHNLEENVLLQYHINYFELPVALKMRTAEWSNYRLFFEFPRLLIGFTGKSRGDITESNRMTEKEDIKKSLTWMNISYGIEGGIEMGLNEDISLYASIEYKKGIFDITDDSGDTSKIKLGNIGLCIGILF